jgi:hypothetical protein
MTAAFTATSLDTPDPLSENLLLEIGRKMKILSALAILCGLAVTLEARSEVKPIVEAVVTGTVQADAGCESDATKHNRPQVWLSLGQILLYQVEVPIKGSFEFHVLPGKYDLVATGPNGCTAETELTVAQDKTQTFDLRLASRTPASSGKKGAK